MLWRKIRKEKEIGSGMINLCSSSGKDLMLKLYVSSFMRMSENEPES